jgi:flagellar basal-body rod protein FlgG
MDKTLRTAATGLTAQQRYIEIISNNLSNVNTTAYKKVRPEFQDLLYETLKPEGGNTQSDVQPQNEVQIGSGTELIATTKQFSQGDVTQTDNPLDVAINGEGFFILRKPDNSYAYTRDGSFKLDRNGQIVSSQGYLLDPGINIPQDAEEIQISRQGVLSILTNNGIDQQSLGQIELARFVNPAGLKNVGENLYIESPASGKAMFEQPGTNNTGELIQSSLEASNVDIVQEMVNMIIAQRSYEMNSKSVQTANDILSLAVNLKR